MQNTKSKNVLEDFMKEYKPVVTKKNEFVSREESIKTAHSGTFRLSKI